VRDHFVRPFVAAFPGVVHAMRNWLTPVHRGAFANVEATGKQARVPGCKRDSTTRDRVRDVERNSTAVGNATGKFLSMDTTSKHGESPQDGFTSMYCGRSARQRRAY
jgi:hypothetical protein